MNRISKYMVYAVSFLVVGGLTACSHNLGTWKTGNNVDYSVTQKSANKYVFKTHVTKQSQVKPVLVSYHKHAVQVCHPKAAKLVYTVKPYKHVDSSDYVHTGYKVKGVVTCY